VRKAGPQLRRPHGRLFVIRHRPAVRSLRGPRVRSWPQARSCVATRAAMHFGRGPNHCGRNQPPWLLDEHLEERLEKAPNSRHHDAEKVKAR